ncbi:MAG: DUF4194 domain-containing protein [Kineosporiaceae bacterium]|nr:DUF4194 domain-containing protein [Kineosporiaceae bacterium]
MTTNDDLIAPTPGRDVDGIEGGDDLYVGDDVDDLDERAAPLGAASSGATYGLDPRALEYLDPDEPLGVSLWEGDEGRLTLDQRRALVALLKNRFITGATHPREWKALLLNPVVVRSRLNEMFLGLHLHRDKEVAYKFPISADGSARYPTLLYDTAWTREETVLLVYLRRRSRAEEANGAPRAFIDRVEMLDHVESLRPAHATDRARDRRRAENAVDSLVSAGLLLGAKGSERYEISPVIDVILPLERLRELLRWLQSENSSDTDRLETSSEANSDEEQSDAEAASAGDEHAAREATP